MRSKPLPQALREHLVETQLRLRDDAPCAPGAAAAAQDRSASDRLDAMRSLTSIDRFISDPNLLGRWFSGESWDNWKLILKGAFAEPLSRSERLQFKQLADRDPPSTRVRELWLAIGRRGGKDSIASAIATYSACCIDFSKYLRPGERATILCLACNRHQARIVHSYIRAYFEEVPLLKPLVVRMDDDSIQLINGVEINVATSSFRGIRGRTIALAILDEISFWYSEGGPYTNPDSEIYSALLPSLMTLRQSGSMIIGISTVYRRSGLLFNKWRQHYGQDGDILVIRQPSVVFNPSLNQADIDADMQLDPERGSAEWLSEFRSDLADFLDRQTVEDCVDIGVRVRPPTQHRYFGFCDPSGGRGDSFACAISHWDNDLGAAVLDNLYEKRSPFDPSSTVEEIAQLLKQYRIMEVVGDKYAANWVESAFSAKQIKYVPSEFVRTDVYLNALPLFTAGRVRLLDNRRLIHQLVHLERRTTRLGRDVIDHAPQSYDDLANATCGALYQTQIYNLNDALWRPEDLMISIPTPEIVLDGHDHDRPPLGSE
jgi:hypothetical protein